jgi:hypothetical protein
LSEHLAPLEPVAFRADGLVEEKGFVYATVTVFPVFSRNVRWRAEWPEKEDLCA